MILRIGILTQHYWPEEIGPAIFLNQLVEDLIEAGHKVTVLTSFPHHPEGVVPQAYKYKLFQKEESGRALVIRSYIYATPRKEFWRRVLSYGSFVISSLIAGVFLLPKSDIMYVVMPPLPLGVTGIILARLKGAKAVLNLQDIHPDVAISTGVLSNRTAIRIFQKMEKWIYGKADRLIVISKGFALNLIGKGTRESKVRVIANWADSDVIRPGLSNRNLRERWGADRFLVVYSGGLTHNSNLETIVEAAALLREEPFRFIIAGAGVRKGSLYAMVQERGLQNVLFEPYVPLSEYPSVLGTADMNVVTLNRAAADLSVPSKIYKIMASGRPVLAIVPEECEIAALINAAQCGICTSPEDHEGVAAALRRAAESPAELERMGLRGREYLEKHHSRKRCTEAINNAFCELFS